MSWRTGHLFPIVQGMKRAGNEVKVIMGARNKDLLIMEEDMKATADEVIVVTDDGSYGRKALVTEPLKELCETYKPDCVVIIGPPIMMKFAALTTKPFGIHTIVSLNTIMIDGTGMCGGCRVTIGGKTKFVCVDGPGVTDIRLIGTICCFARYLQEQEQKLITAAISAQIKEGRHEAVMHATR